MSGSVGGGGLDPQTMAGLLQFVKLIQMQRAAQAYQQPMGAGPQMPPATAGAPLQGVMGAPPAQAPLGNSPVIGGIRAPMPGYLRMPMPQGV